MFQGMLYTKWPRGKSNVRACLAACSKVRRILAWGFGAVIAVRVVLLWPVPAVDGSKGKDHICLRGEAAKAIV